MSHVPGRQTRSTIISLLIFAVAGGACATSDDNACRYGHGRRHGHGGHHSDRCRRHDRHRRHDQ